MDNVLTAIYTRPWAILPAKLEAIADVVERHARGEQLSADTLALYSAQNRRPQASRSGKIAVLPLYGVMAQRMNMMTEMSGGTSTELFGKQFRALVDDPEVTAIVIDVDSPGGEVSGVAEVAEQVYAARGTKPIIAIANPLMASAAYYIASAADEVVATVDSEIGSIGTFFIHTDRSAAAAKAGVTHTVIKAGKFKAESLPIQPLSEEARAHMQSIVDDAYAQFVAAVAKHRGTSPDAVRNGYGQGRTQFGARAVTSGLADRVSTLENVLAELSGNATRTIRVAAASPPTPALAAVAAAVTDAAPTGAAFSHPAVQASAGEAALGVSIPLANQLAPQARSEPVSTENTAAPGAAPNTPSVIVGADRGAAIADLCVLAGVPERTAEFIQSGRSAEQVRGELFEMRRKQAAAPATPPRPQIEDYESGRQRFSLGKAIVAAAANDWSQAGFEREVSVDLERRARGIEGAGPLKGVRGTTFYFPTLRKLSDQEREARMQAAAHVAGTGSVGGELVFTEYGGFIDLLRTRMVLAAMGATFIPGLQGNVSFPRQITSGTSNAVAEGLGGTDVTESNMTLDSVDLTPKTLMARQRYSNQLLAQNVVNIDTLIRNDLAAIQARKVDFLGLHGVGSNNEPLGLYAQTGVNTVTFSGGPTYAKCVDMEAAVEADDADIGAMGYIFTPEIKGKAKTTPTFTNVGTPIWTGSAAQGEVNGYRAMATNQLSKTLVSGTNSDCHGGIFGAWAQLLIGEWGGMAVTVDPYTLAGIDQVRIIAREFFDVGCRHGESFTKAIALRNV